MCFWNPDPVQIPASPAPPPPANKTAPGVKPNKASSGATKQGAAVGIDALRTALESATTLSI